MKKLLLGIGVWIGLVCVLAAQGVNPFELTPRLSPAAQQERSAAVEDAPVEAPPGNPFELQPRLRSTTAVNPAQSLGSDNPFELRPRQTALKPPTPVETQPKIVIQKEATEPSVASDAAWVLPSLVGLLTLTAIFFIFFRGLYEKAYRAMFNDHLMTQLYRERSSGIFGGFILTYVLFLLSAALFLTILANRFGYGLTLPTRATFLWILAGLSGAFLLKHLVLAIIGYVFPVHKETSRYSFTIMISAIVLGPVLALASLTLAYCAPGLQWPLLYGCTALVVGAYIIRSLRGLFIANRFLPRYVFHFLLYLYAIEIVPLLWIYKVILQGSDF